MPVDSTIQPRPTSLSDNLRIKFKGILDFLGGLLNRLGVAPITLTLLGLAGHFVAAVFLGSGKFLIGGLLLLVMAPVDALDGTLARLRGEPSAFALELPPYRRPRIGQVLFTSLIDRTVFVLGRAVTVAAPAGGLIWLLANVHAGDASLAAHLAGFLDPLAAWFGLDGVIFLAFLIVVSMATLPRT